MKYQDIISDLRQGKFQPVYLLSGEEAFFIDELTNLIIDQALRPEERDFNQSILYGRETDMQTVINEAKRYPMMSERVLVLVKEAQHLRNWDLLEPYLEQPQSSTVLVFAFKEKKPDKRKKVFKTLSNRYVFFSSKKLYDNELPHWIESRLKMYQYRIDPVATRMIAESVGSDLSRLDNELNKLLLGHPKETIISPEVVEANIGISKDYNNFELQDALAHRDLARIIRIQQYFASAPKNHPLLLTISALYRFFSQIMLLHYHRGKPERELARVLGVHPFFLKDYQLAARAYGSRQCAYIIGYLREYDARSKGVGNVGVPHEELLRELLLKIYYT